MTRVERSLARASQSGAARCRGEVLRTLELEQRAVSVLELALRSGRASLSVRHACDSLAKLGRVEWNALRTAVSLRSSP